MPTLRRAFRRIAFIIVAVLALSWLYLYLDSVRERRKAEHLIADLRSFPFATSGLPEVRQLTNQYGGTAVQSFPLPKFLPPGVPLRFPWHPDSEMPLPQVRTRPTCTPEDCTFLVRIAPRICIYDLHLNYRISEFLASALAYVGLRPWAVQAEFEIKDGKLWGSRSGAGQVRRRTVSSYRGMIWLGYEVIYASNASASHRPEYCVGVPHITGTISDDLWTYFAQTTASRASHAFDIDIGCFTALTHACSGFGELSPSAWADYQARVEPQARR